MTTDEFLKQGIAALKAGRKAEARRLLMQVVRQDKHNEMAWLWLSGAVDTDEDRRACLENVLAINPNNGLAKRGLETLLANKGVRPLSTVPVPALEAKRPNGKPVAQSVAETRRDVKPESDGKSRKPVWRTKATEGKTSPSWTWLLIGSGGTTILLLVGCVLAYALGFIQLPSNVLATPTSLPSPTPLSTSTLTPDQVYAYAMEPALEDLYSWLNGPVADWDTLMAQKTSSSGQESTYGIEVSLAIQYPNLYVYSDDKWNELQRKVLPAASSMADGGFEALSSLGAATPPASIRVAHEQIITCVEYKTEFANAIVDFLTRVIIPDMESRSDPCNYLPLAVDQVDQFIKRNQ